MAETKFCGLTRREDLREAVRLGATHVGVIFAGGPRSLTAGAAREVLHEAIPGTRRVGVFGVATPGEISRLTTEAGIDIVQLHGDPDAATVRAVRVVVDRPVWAVVRIGGSVLPHTFSELFAEADAVVLDARADHALGGTGLALRWSELAPQVEAVRGGTRLVLAGGLTPGNVREAIDALSPDIVDVSSGVESSPGIKDHSLMRAFIQAARSAPRAA
jgi:phosphoribosylanthranilate isomerase